MEKKVKQYIQKHQLINPQDMVIVAVSGGSDSMALVHILYELSEKMYFNISVAHLNHALRDEAINEERFIQSFCEKNNISFYAKTIDVKKYAAQKKIGIEEAGREQRYKYFNELCQALKANKIATAHHYDDQAETVLLHLLRGSGIKGLRGMLPQNGNIIRPLLEVPQKHICHYLEKNKIEYCLDPSNMDVKYLRNKIRKHLIPLLEKDYNPQIVHTLGKLAEISREENDIIELEVDKFWEQISADTRKGEIIIKLEILNSIGLGLQKRIIKKALSDLAGESAWEKKDIEEILSLASKAGSSKKLSLKKSVKVLKSYDKLVFTYDIPEVNNFSYQVTIPGSVYIPETAEEYFFDVQDKNSIKREDYDICLDYEKVKMPLFIRSRQAGDRFHPIGLKGSKKIKDYFIDKKIPFYERNKIAILAGNTIYAVLDYTVSAEVAVNKQSNKILLIKKKSYD